MDSKEEKSIVIVSEDDKKLAEEKKAEGNTYFQANKFHEALKHYDEAIALNPTNPVYFSNRAIVHLKLEENGSAIADASSAIELDPNFVKAYYRRGCGYLALGKVSEARKDFRVVTQKNPRDKDAQTRLAECEKIIRQRNFAKAIESEVPPPASKVIDLASMAVDQSYTGPRLEGPITLEFVLAMLDEFKNQRQIHRKYAYQIIVSAIEVFSALPSLVDIEVPQGTHITVCGDTHGQYYDLLNIFEINGMPSPENPYLFNGDFVDRGSFSAEVILTLLAFKVLYPSGMHLTRGNHESENMNKMYGFEGEMVNKYGKIGYDLCTEVFCWLPLAACLGGRVLVVHGGLFSKDGVTLDQIRQIDRNCQPPDSGPMSEILWSDPQPQRGWGPSKRGVGASFGPDVTHRFLDANGLDLLVRSHEMKDNGYEVEAGGRLITIFSAPNYCDTMKNKGAFIRFESDLKPKFTTFDAVPHPAVRPMAYASPLFNSF